MRRLRSAFPTVALLAATISALSVSTFARAWCCARDAACPMQEASDACVASTGCGGTACAEPPSESDAASEPPGGTNAAPEPSASDVTSPRPSTRDVASPTPSTRDVASPTPSKRDVTAPLPSARDAAVPADCVPTPERCPLLVNSPSEPARSRPPDPAPDDVSFFGPHAPPAIVDVLAILAPPASVAPRAPAVPDFLRLRHFLI
jgi:hypothetical protein